MIEKEIHTWKKQFPKGQIGVEQFIHFLKERGKFKNIRDVSDIAKYQRLGIDVIGNANDLFFSCLSRKKYKNEARSFEVKSDYYAHKTGNIIYELMEKAEMGKLGWGLTSHAQYLVNYIVYENKFVILLMEDFRRQVYTHWSSLFPYDSPHQHYTTIGMKIPLSLLQECSSYCEENGPSQLLLTDILEQTVINPRGEGRKRESGKAGKRESEKAGKRESGKAGKRESEKAGKRESEKAGKRESEKAGKRESEKAGKRESEKAGKRESF